MTNKTKQNRNKRDNNSEDDEYVYPTAKVRETKTRNRRSDKNLIKRSLVDLENPEFDDEATEDQEIMDDYNEMIEEFNAVDDEPYDADYFPEDREHLDLGDDYGYDWENY